MPKIERKTQKVFAGQANSDELAVFGSMKTGTPVYTNDIEQLQSNEAYTQGWQDALVADKAPFLEEMNGIQYGLSKQIAYTLQEGWAEYDAGTTYYKGSVVKSLNEESIPVVYYSITDDNTGNPLTDNTNWAVLEFGGTGNAIGDPVVTLNSTLKSNEIWLEGAEVSKTTYSNLYAIYGDTYGTPTDETNFVLPDFRNRTLWGSADGTYGYIEAGLPNITGVHVSEIYASPDYANGAFQYGAGVGSSGAGNSGAWTGTRQLSFDASRSNSVYSNEAETVQPPSIKIRVKTRYK